MSARGIAFCLSEDRLDCETGLRLAVLSLCKHCPGASIYVYRPLGDGDFGAWVKQFPQVVYIPDRPEGASQWNCKPQALKPLLDRGHSDAVWLDADVIVTSDCRRLFASLDESVVAIAQEPRNSKDQGTESRTLGWGLKVGRSLPFTLNSAVLRVTRRHIPLLQDWRERLADPQYILAHKLPIEERPTHMMGDQDVLNGLLGSQEFAHIPLRIFQTGSEIIHLGGELAFSTTERLRGVFGPCPTFMHAIGGKPWLWLGGDPYWSKRNLFSWHRRLLQELSPYVYEVRQYASELGASSEWMYRRTVTGTILRMAGLGHFALRGLPLTAAAGMVTSARQLLRTA